MVNKSIIILLLYYIYEHYTDRVSFHLKARRQSIFEHTTSILQGTEDMRESKHSAIGSHNSELDAVWGKRRESSVDRTCLPGIQLGDVRRVSVRKASHTVYFKDKELS